MNIRDALRVIGEMSDGFDAALIMAEADQDFDPFWLIEGFPYSSTAKVEMCAPDLETALIRFAEEVTK